MSKDKWNDHTRRDSRRYDRLLSRVCLNSASAGVYSFFSLSSTILLQIFHQNFVTTLPFPQQSNRFYPRNCFFFVSFNRPLIALQMEKESRRRSNSVSSRMDTLEGILGELRRAVAE